MAYQVNDRVYLRNSAGGTMFDAHGHAITFTVIRVTATDSGATYYALRTADRDANRMYGGGLGFTADCLIAADA